MTINEPKFAVGDEVFTRDPGRFIAGARAIIGEVRKIMPIGSTFQYEFDADRVAINTGPGVCDFYWRRVGMVYLPEQALGLRGGIPISQLDGRNGGNAAWRRLSESWGYP